MESFDEVLTSMEFECSEPVEVNENYLELLGDLIDVLDKVEDMAEVTSPSNVEEPGVRYAIYGKTKVRIVKKEKKISSSPLNVEIINEPQVEPSLLRDCTTDLLKMKKELNLEQSEVAKKRFRKSAEERLAFDENKKVKSNKRRNFIKRQKYFKRKKLAREATKNLEKQREVEKKEAAKERQRRARIHR